MFENLQNGCALNMTICLYPPTFFSLFRNSKEFLNRSFKKFSFQSLKNESLGVHFNDFAW